MKTPAALSQKYRLCARKICQYSVAKLRPISPATARREVGTRMARSPNMSTIMLTGCERKNMRSCVVKIYDIEDKKLYLRILVLYMSWKVLRALMDPNEQN
jgi:hypothetical protein